MSRIGPVNRGNTSLNNLVGIGSNIQVEDLDEANICDNSETSTESKRYRHKHGSTVLSDTASVTERGLIIFGTMPMILFLIECILFMKNPIKSSLLREGGIFGSTEL